MDLREREKNGVGAISVSICVKYCRLQLYLVKFAIKKVRMLSRASVMQIYQRQCALHCKQCVCVTFTKFAEIRDTQSVFIPRD